MKGIWVLTSLLLLVFSLQAQTLGKRIKEAGARTAENKAEQKTAEAVDQGIDKTIQGVKKIFTKKTNKKIKEPKDDTKEKNLDSWEFNANRMESVGGETVDTSGTEFGIYSQFTFVPGSKDLFYDDFSADELGDFPANWETAVSVEVVTVTDQVGKWLSLVRRSGYLPTIQKELPVNYTVEFDLISHGYDEKGFSKLYFVLMPKKAYSMGQAGSVAYLELVLRSYLKVTKVENFGSEATMRVTNTIDRNRTDLINTKVHVSIAVNGKRLRIWLDNEKYVDAPNILQGKLGRYFLIEAFDIKPENFQFVGISNVRIAESEEDLRSKLLKKGRFTTTGIYFNTNSQVVKKESYGTIKSIAEMLKADGSIRVKIVGHTDTDGDASFNQQLSIRRAESVKNILVKEFGIDSGRMEHDGKGETEPVDDNTNEIGKANNRRVEFIKL